MTPQEIDTLKNQLIDAVSKSAAQQVDISVNGKINKLTVMMQDHIASDTAYKADMTEWRKEITPVIKVGKQVIDWGIVTAWIFASIAGASGILVLILDFVRKGK